MRRTLRTTLAATAVVGLLAIPVAGANANSNSVSFTVASSSTLSVANDDSAVTLQDGGSNPVFDAANPGAVSGSLPATTVTDQRGTLAGAWTVTVASDGNWENQADTTITVPASNARVYFDAATLADLSTTLDVVTGGMLLTGAELVDTGSDLSNPYTLLSGTTTLGNGSITYTPAIDITVPAATPAGTYEAVVNQTIS